MARNSMKSISRLINLVNTAETPDKAFIKDLERSIEQDAMQGARKPSQSYKPSSMQCIRNMYYQMIGAEPDKSDTTYSMVGVCNTGTDTHIRIQTAIANMKANGFDCEYVDVAEFVRIRGLDYLEIVSQNGMETKLWHKTLRMSFLCDGIIKYQNKYYILEIKTETSSKWNVREGVDPKHYNQGTSYSIAFQLPDVMFVYINRDFCTMKSYIYTPTDEQKQNLIGLIDTCDSYVVKMSCPPKPADVSKTTCNYCGYKNQCRKD